MNRIVHDEDRRIVGERAGEAQALFLAAGKADAKRVLKHHRGIMGRYSQVVIIAVKLCIMSPTPYKLIECIKFISFIFTKFKNIRQFFSLTLPRNLLHPGNPAVKRHPRMPDKRFFPHHLQSVIKIPNNDHSYHAVCL